MALVNFYRMLPTAAQLASDLNSDELAVFDSSRVGARGIALEVKALVDFDVNLHHENTELKWAGADFFVMVRSSFDYGGAKREKLLWIAKDWIRAGCPDRIRGL